MSSSETAASAAGRPRDPALEAAILDATQDLLIEHGFAATTVEAVARAAGTGKAAVYRRWPSKIDLVIAAIQALQSPPTVPDTGTLRGDLLECAMHFVQPDRRPALVLAGVLNEIGRNSDLRDAAYEAIGKPPATAFAAVLQRWRARGQVTSSAPTDLLAGIVPAAAFRNVAFRRRALDHRTAVDLVDFVLLPALQHLPRVEASPEILAVSWGRLEVEGLGVVKDLKAWPGGARPWDWTETGTSHSPGIQPADVEELLAAGAVAVVLSQGMENRLEVPRSTVDWLAARGITVHVAETTEAIELYNRLRETTAVGGLFHSTC